MRIFDLKYKNIFNIDEVPRYFTLQSSVNLEQASKQLLLNTLFWLKEYIYNLGEYIEQAFMEYPDNKKILANKIKHSEQRKWKK